MQRWKNTLDTVATIAMIIAAGVLIWKIVLVPSDNRKRESLAVPKSPVSIAGSPVVGDPRTRAVMVEFSDFECPFCGQFARETMPAIQRDYVSAGKLRVAFRHNPLAMHLRAPAAAQSATCAAAQGKFWEMHNLLFAKPSLLADEDLKKKAMDAGVEKTAFEACMTRGGNSVERDLADAKALGIQTTPAFLFGLEDQPGSVRISSVLTGAAPFSVFSKTLDELLAVKPSR